MNKVYAVGIGPGDYESMTLRAVHTLQRVGMIVGYRAYVELIRPYFPDKEYHATAMRGEVERCRFALCEACAGRDVALISSGDAGVYGMAGLLFELRAQCETPEIEVVPGLTAACTGAALLGAPLTHDFAVISLSDLLTDWATIEQRVKAAAQCGLAIAIYNPASMKRRDNLKRACEAALLHLSPDTVCAVAKNIGRQGECVRMMTLRSLSEYQADMFTTAFIGNAATRLISGNMVTPRGYKLQNV